MEMVLMSGNGHPQLARMEKMLEGINGLRQVRRFESAHDLEQGLRSPSLHPGLAVFLVGDSCELAELITLRDLLRGAKLIVVLPEATPALVSLGHALTPSLLTNRNADLGEIEAVIRNIIQKSGQAVKHAAPAN